MSAIVLKRSRGSVAELLSGRDNGVGAIRLALALSVVVSHSRPLGFGQNDVGFFLTGKQTNLGTMAVYGFFVLSGMLITRSARRTNLIRYAWHRALRIFPGLWVCLLVTALVVAPLVTLHEHGTLSGFWHAPWAPGGPLAYLRANWWTGVRQYGIRDLLQVTTPWGRITNSSVFDGALWSLVYEMLCYVGIGILAITSVLNRSRRLVLILTVVAYLSIVADYAHSHSWSGPALMSGGSFTAPLVGGLSVHWLTYLGFMFLFGAVVDLYRERIPVHDGLGILSLVVLVASMLLGGFFVLGLPAYAYFLIWLSIRMPRRLRWIGRKNDYSYGIYIYGFLGQQVLASVHANRWGFVPFVLIAIVTAFAAAFVSWHVVERHALRLKGWTPRLPGRKGQAYPDRPAGTEPPSAALDPTTPAPSPAPEAAPAPSAVLSQRDVVPGAQPSSDTTDGPLAPVPSNA